MKLFGAHPPNAQNSDALDDFGSAAAPGHGYIMGTDALGRDVFSRTIYGARISLESAFIATALIVMIGVTLGMIAGYYRGVGRHRAVALDGRVLAFPVLLLALGLGAACSLKGCLTAAAVGRDLFIVAAIVLLIPVIPAAVSQAARAPGLHAASPPATGSCAWRRASSSSIIAHRLLVRRASTATLIQPGLPVVIFVITLAGWPYMARIIRGQVLSLREKEFVEAARSLGASDARIIFRHILPNLVAPIIVYTTLLIPTNILFEAALSFLGVGVQPPTASWGAMIADAIAIFDTAWWYMTFPGVALLLTVLAFNCRRRTAGRAQSPDGALRAPEGRAVHSVPQQGGVPMRRSVRWTSSRPPWWRSRCSSPHAAAVITAARQAVAAAGRDHGWHQGGGG